MSSLNNKVAVITGGTRGFGFSVAEAFVRAGASVVVSSRSAEAVAQAVDALRVGDVRVSGIAADVGDLSQVEALAAHAQAAFGGFDIWINNAGLAGVYGPTVHVPVGSFVRVTETNILGVYYGSIVAMRHFLARGSGKLINVTGRGAREPVPFQNAYASSKGWVRDFTLALAREYNKSGVGVFVLSPGMMTTEMLTDVEVVAGYESRLKVMPTVLRMWARPPEAPAERAVWLASSATDGRTGLEIHEMNPLAMIIGAAAEGLRRVTGRRRVPVEVNLKLIPPAIKEPL